MKYYILSNNWDYDCLKDEIIPEIYEEESLDLGISFESLPAIDLILKSEKLPNSIPNHQQYLFFDKKIQDIISMFDIDYLEYFDVNVFDKRKVLISSEYKTINILKIVDAIDKSKSQLVLDDDDITDVINLSLNYNNIKGEIMFRLQDCVTLVVIREDLVQAIVNAKCTGLDFFDAEGFGV